VRRHLLTLALLALAVGAAGDPAQQPTAAFPSKVELITVDAVVVDSAGRPVSGLTRDDFVVTEDGNPREITSFEAFVSEMPAASPAAPPSASVSASNEAALVRAGRGFALIVDDVGLSFRDSTETRRAVSTFLERSLRDGDEVSLGTTSGDAWWSARLPEGREDLLAVAARVKGRDLDSSAPDVMSDYEAFSIVNHESASGPVTARVVARWKRANICQERDPGCPALVGGRARDLDGARQTRTRLILEAVRRGLGALAPIRGHKSLVLFSRGFLQDSGTDLRDVVATSREANAAVYFVDVRGLVAQPGLPSAADAGGAAEPAEVGAMAFEAGVLDSAGAQTLADDTGGFSVRNTNDLAAGAARIAEESRAFYMLGFHPPEGKSEREWRKLRVEVKRPGLTVRARRGYTLRAAAGAPVAAGPDKKGKPKSGPDPAIVRALDSAHDAVGIPLRAMAYVFEPRPKDTTYVVVAVELDVSGLAVEPKGKSRIARLDVSVIATNRDSGRGFRHDDRLEFAVEGSESPSWRALAREFELPTGVTQARVVVRDVASGTVGSVAQRFLIPPPGVLRVSTPILTNHLAPKKDGQARAQPALAVHRRFAAHGVLYCQFEVFGAARAAGSAAPRVAGGLELRTQDGRVVLNADPTPIAADADGRVVRMVGVPLDGMEDGSYELVLGVRDEVSGDRLERREPFILARDAASP
jgi:VWFA-related protein